MDELTPETDDTSAEAAALPLEETLAFALYDDWMSQRLADLLVRFEEFRLPRRLFPASILR